MQIFFFYISKSFLLMIPDCSFLKENLEIINKLINYNMFWFINDYHAGCSLEGIIKNKVKSNLSFWCIDQYVLFTFILDIKIMVVVHRVLYKIKWQIFPFWSKSLKILQKHNKYWKKYVFISYHIRNILSLSWEYRLYLIFCVFYHFS